MVILAASLTAQTNANSGKSGAGAKTQRPSKSQTRPTAEEPPESSAAKPVFENQRVRVFRHELSPGASVTTPEHKTEHLLIPIGEISLRSGSGRALPARSGEVQILKRGGSEHFTNAGTTDAIVIEVEALGGVDLSYVICGMNGVRCESILGGDLKGGTWGINTLIKTPSLEIATTDIDPGVVTDELAPRSGGRLRIALTNLELAEQVADEAPRLLNEPAGSVAWVEGGPQVALKNMGATPAKFVSVIFP